ncbi:zinc-finger homeodomain protein 2-like [Abrus precatorius]|uniref:Zinc-finger homeodomain protein 2-like n=1 Tax=Abrus precatorius TaxID=3816 RepID=A0A8B8KW34_ABRPR|nr:zinc-finger homeodomain protein 2-like [Abrus precatorius]
MKLLCGNLNEEECEREFLLARLFSLQGSLLMLDCPIPLRSHPPTQDSHLQKMEFEDQEEPELGIHGPSYDDSPLNACRVKMPSHIEEEPPVLSHPAIRNTGRGRYKECLKNHAVGIGGHALDGCCEFMAAGAEGTLDALKCAACNCHRNFHRKETDAVAEDHFASPFHPRRHQPPQFAAYYRAPAGYLHVAGQQRVGATLALPSTSGGGGGTQSPREDQEDASDPSGGGSKKRFRTKFTREQKDKMLEFAEKLGWRIQKHDESVVQEFCSQTGVKRRVLKVWMHNNKHTLGKKP